MVFELPTLPEYSWQANGSLPRRNPWLLKGAKPSETIFTLRPFHGWQIQEFDHEFRKKSRDSTGGSAGAGRVRYKHQLVHRRP
jgi:hypothetical protein